MHELYWCGKELSGLFSEQDVVSGRVWAGEMGRDGTLKVNAKPIFESYLGMIENHWRM